MAATGMRLAFEKAVAEAPGSDLRVMIKSRLHTADSRRSSGWKVKRGGKRGRRNG